MKAERAQAPVRLSVIFAAYYAVLVAFLVASFFPEHRLWSVNWWAYFPGYVPFVPCCRMTLPDSSNAVRETHLHGECVR
jgi:hypothetical protein